MDSEEFKTISAAVCSFVAIGQINGEPEKKKKWFNFLSQAFFEGEGSVQWTHLIFKNYKG
jgi:hypothetical protein